MGKDSASLMQRIPRAWIMGMDVLLILVCVGSAQILSKAGPGQEAWLFGLAPLMAAPVFVRFGLYRAVLKYIGTKAIYAVVQAIGVHVTMVAIAIAMVDSQLTLRFSIIYGLMCLVLIGGSRVVLRAAVRWWDHSARCPLRVAIFGAGSAGAQLAEMLKLSTDLYPVAFLDDKSELHGHEILGLTVFPTKHLSELIATYGVKEVLLAIPSVSQARRNQITRFLEAYRVHVRTVPTLEELVSDESKLRELRELDLNDLLERESVVPDVALLERCIAGKSVMVTGAGGSIGSELCRQILKHRPRQLVLFERSEYALYTVEQEIKSLLQAKHDIRESVDVVPLLGSVTDENYLKLVLSSFGVQTLYHAAAYKHVPMVEHNPLQGIINNVFGTVYCARAAVDAGVETFTLISTDKAVRPANVMGATKRLAELIIQAYSARHNKTRFVVVRFGNVLGSSGSVVPLFREQIRRGGPITITHEEITRYFMTIPEAAQLVIQASAMGSDGDVFVLDMGQPVKIMDLARRMIALNGLTIRDDNCPNGDVAIQVTSLRPGEKLHEELVVGGAVRKTAHPRIMRVKEESISLSRLTEVLRDLEASCQGFDSKDACDVLRSVTGYRQDAMVDFLWKRRTSHKSATDKLIVGAGAVGQAREML